MAAWLNSSWGYREEIVSNPAKVDEDPDFLPFFLSNLTSTFFSNVDASGDDIRVTESDGTTEVPFFIINIDTVGEDGCIVINVAGNISTTVSSTFFIYYGNASAMPYGVSDTYGQYNVFDANTLAFYLPGESTSNYAAAGNALTANGSPTSAASTIEGIDAAVLNGTSQYFSADPVVTDWGFTLMVNAKISGFASNSVVASFSDSSVANDRAQINLSTHPRAQGQAIGDGGAGSTASNATTLGTSLYYQFVLMRDAAVGTTTIQVTEIETDTDATTIASASFTDFTIGALEDNSLGDYFNGRVAIVDISNTTRSANYRTTRKNGWDDDLFGHWNKAETYAANSTGWFEFTSAVSTTPGTDVWSNPSFALTNLNTAAEVAVEEGDFSQTLKVTNASSFLSSYDDALEIVGIEAEIAFLGDNGGSEEMEDSTLQVIISGAQTGTNKATRTLWETTPVPLYVNAGGSSDIWGLSSPTMADFKATTSGLALQLESVGGVSSEPAVDCLRMRMRLHYAAAASVDSGFFAMMEAF